MEPLNCGPISWNTFRLSAWSNVARLPPIAQERPDSVFAKTSSHVTCVDESTELITENRRPLEDCRKSRSPDDTPVVDIPVTTADDAVVDAELPVTATLGPTPLFVSEPVEALNVIGELRLVIMMSEVGVVVLLGS